MENFLQTLVAFFALSLELFCMICTIFKLTKGNHLL